MGVVGIGEAWVVMLAKNLSEYRIVSKLLMIT